MSRSEPVAGRSGPVAGWPGQVDPGARRRLDVRTVASRVLTVSALRKQWGLVVGTVAILGLRGGFRAAGLLVALVAVLVVSAAAAVVEWVRTTYAVGGGRLVVERGLLRRSLTVVPLDRIRGVEVQASALQRLLGIATVRVDAAATGRHGDEAELDAVSAADARELRDVLLREGRDRHAGPASTGGPAVGRLGSGEPAGVLGAPGAPGPRLPGAGAAVAGAEGLGVGVARPGPPRAPGHSGGPGDRGHGGAGHAGEAAGPAETGTWVGAGSPGGSGGERRAAAPAGAAGGIARGEPDVVVLARFHPRWLLYAPLVGGYLLAPLAALGAAAQLLDDIRLPVISEDRLGRLLLTGPRLSTIVLLAVAALTLAVIGSVVTATVANWAFTLTRRGGTLVAERGLLSRRQVSLEIDRIRGYALAQPLGLRAAGAARLTALVTGLGPDDGEGVRGRRGQLLPLGPAAVARDVAAAAVLPFRAPLRPHPPAARRRRLGRAVAPWLLLAVGLAIPGFWPGVAVAVVLAALGVPLGLDRYAGLGHGLDDRAVSVRSGSLRRSQVVLERRGVVGWTVRQSWFQRRAGLATVTVATGAGTGGYDAIDVDAADAVRLMTEVDPRRVGPLVRRPAAGPGAAESDHGRSDLPARPVAPPTTLGR
ncbi:MAG TPA: PH domain-containing protein [Mycobacteriales bacterium]|nr:PH domain-containing protein [Mycobacteriales bacterium]